MNIQWRLPVLSTKLVDSSCAELMQLQPKILLMANIADMDRLPAMTTRIDTEMNE